MLLRFRAAALALITLLAVSPALAQSPANDRQQPTYTFHAGTRVVLTDVTVMDKRGNPVHGLKASDFKIFDNNKPQALVSFEEHTTEPVTSLPSASSAPGVFSNAFLEHLPPVLNIIVLDTTNLEIPDQMYLNYQLTRFINTLPLGEPVALYWASGPASFLLQTFTSDHALLLSALHRALPHFPPADRLYYNDFTTLRKIAVDFGQYPGRKNILWFSGGSTLSLKPDPDDLPTVTDWRTIYDELESGRIAIYPIDARGLIVISPRDRFGLLMQHELMDDIAQTTGGHAYYDTNGLSQAAAHWLDTSGDFYTITYSPAHFHVDDKWHNVTVKLTCGGNHYSLSYRRGYFADSLGAAGPRPSKKSRTVLLAGDKTVIEPDLRSLPLIFQAHIVRTIQAPGRPPEIAHSPNMARPAKGTIPYSIHYLLPLAQFTPRTVNGKEHFEFEVAAFSFDENGTTITRLATSISFDVNEAALRQSPRVSFPFDQRINLRKGQNYLYLAVWDVHSGRLGTLQIPFEAAKPR